MTLQNRKGAQEKLQLYHGGFVMIQGGEYFFRRFEEVWNETNNRRWLTEQLGFESLPSSLYQAVGTDFFVPFLKVLGISTQTSKKMHAGSDREGFAKAISERLTDPEELTPIDVHDIIFQALNTGNAWDLQRWHQMAVSAK